MIETMIEQSHPKSRIGSFHRGTTRKSAPVSGMFGIDLQMLGAEFR
jgi:hypothetical protein